MMNKEEQNIIVNETLHQIELSLANVENLAQQLYDEYFVLQALFNTVRVNKSVCDIKRKKNLPISID